MDSPYLPILGSSLLSVLVLINYNLHGAAILEDCPYVDEQPLTVYWILHPAPSQGADGYSAARNP